jgi:hypothetical protein
MARKIRNSSLFDNPFEQEVRQPPIKFRKTGYIVTYYPIRNNAPVSDNTYCCYFVNGRTRQAVVPLALRILQDRAESDESGIYVSESGEMIPVNLAFKKDRESIFAAERTIARTGMLQTWDERRLKPLNEVFEIYLHTQSITTIKQNRQGNQNNARRVRTITDLSEPEYSPTPDLDLGQCLTLRREFLASIGFVLCRYAASTTIPSLMPTESLFVGSDLLLRFYPAEKEIPLFSEDRNLRNSIRGTIGRYIGDKSRINKMTNRCLQQLQEENRSVVSFKVRHRGESEVQTTDSYFWHLCPVYDFWDIYTPCNFKDFRESS